MAMKNRRMLAATAAAGLLGSMFAAQASACNVNGLNTAASPAQASAFAQFVAGMNSSRQRAHSGTLAGAPNLSAYANPSIVGLWRFAFTAPDDSALDWGFQTWHSDGTEITNSGGRPPRSGNFCMGVWSQQAKGEYDLNHWAISWGDPPDFDDSSITGIINIREHVVLDKSGDSMSGTVSLDLYDLDGTTFLAHLVDGTVTGTRISP
jgi:hypothetical protein